MDGRHRRREREAGQGKLGRGHVPAKFRENIFRENIFRANVTKYSGIWGQTSRKIQPFSGKYHVKFVNFVTFRANIMQKFEHFC